MSGQLSPDGDSPARSSQPAPPDGRAVFQPEPKTNSSADKNKEPLSDLRFAVEIFVFFFVAIGGLTAGVCVVAWAGYRLHTHQWAAAPTAVPVLVLGITLTCVLPVLSLPVSEAAGRFVVRHLSEARGAGAKTEGRTGRAAASGMGGRRGKMVVVAVGCVVIVALLQQRSEIARQGLEIRDLRSQLDLIMADVLEIKSAM